MSLVGFRNKKIKCSREHHAGLGGGRGRSGGVINWGVDSECDSKCGGKTLEGFRRK